MAARKFRRKSDASTPEARFEASRIQDARRRGYTNREIGQAFGINERTVRKIVSGDTSGKRIYRERIAPTRELPPEAQNLSIVRLDLVVGQDAQGRDVIRTVNARTPLVNGRTPTPFDALRLPDLANVADAEIARLRAQYAGAIDITENCARRNCHHPIGDHADHTGECRFYGEGKDRCDEYVPQRSRISSIRPIIRRDPAKRLVVIRGMFA